MKKLIYAILCGMTFSACASIKTFTDPNVSIYMGRFRDISGYFYLNKGSEFYMFDYGNVCEIGVCKITQDTLYCYPRLNKWRSSKETEFKTDTISLFYDNVQGPNLEDHKNVYEVKYLIEKDRLVFVYDFERGGNIVSDIFYYPEEAFLRQVEIKNIKKYRKHIVTTGGVVK